MEIQADTFSFSPLFCILHVTDLSFQKDDGVEMLLWCHGYGYGCRERLFLTRGSIFNRSEPVTVLTGAPQHSQTGPVCFQNLKIILYLNEFKSF